MQPSVCPRCSSEHIKRVSRIGPERLISLFYIYPFRCEPCGHRFRLFQRGVTYTRMSQTDTLDRKPGSGNERRGGEGFVIGVNSLSAIWTVWSWARIARAAATVVLPGLIMMSLVAEPGNSGRAVWDRHQCSRNFPLRWSC